MTALRTIMLAWPVEETRVVRERRTDLGERPVLETVREGRACVWLNEGTAEDVAKAEAYAASPDSADGCRVFLYALGTDDVFGKARAAVIRVTPASPAPK